MVSQEDMGGSPGQFTPLVSQEDKGGSRGQPTPLVSQEDKGGSLSQPTPLVSQEDKGGSLSQPTPLVSQEGASDHRTSVVEPEKTDNSSSESLLLSLAMRVTVAYVSIALQQFDGFVAQSNRQVMTYLYSR